MITGQSPRAGESHDTADVALRAQWHSVRDARCGRRCQTGKGSRGTTGLDRARGGSGLLRAALGRREGYTLTFGRALSDLADESGQLGHSRGILPGSSDVDHLTRIVAVVVKFLGERR